jgi:hypothetical protein
MQRRIGMSWLSCACLSLTLACVGGVVESGGARPGPAGSGGASGKPGGPDAGVGSGSAGGSSGSNNGGSNGTPATDAGTPPGAEKPPSTLPGTSACMTDVPGPRLLRRLTTAELQNTLEDLFKDPSVPKTTALADPEVLGFHVDAAQLLVRDLGAQQLADFADEVAQWAVTNKLAGLSTCTTTDPACRQTFIKSFGRQAFRAPLSEAQVKAYDGLFAGEASFADGAAAVMATMLQSPNLLYRRELGTPDSGKPGMYLLTPHEVASNLAYLLTQGPPDQLLAQAADSNALGTAAALDAQADRLMKTPRGRKTLGAFVRGWLGLDRLESVAKDDKVFALTAGLRKDMLGESEALFLDVFDRNGTLVDLLTANYSFVNLGLSQFYGVGSGAGGAGYIRVMRPASERDPGILGHAAVLATHATGSESSPVKRGKLVRTRLLCQSLPDPPQDVDTTLKPAAASQTTRQRYLQHATDGACAGCHKLMDPIGFGFERYDGFGRRREMENGVMVDSSGSLTATAAGDIPFNGLGELGATLAKTEEAKACLIRYWSYFAFGVASWPQDGCTQAKLLEESAKGQYSLRSVLMAIIHSPHFTRRVGP